jgi:hypothetical protein
MISKFFKNFDSMGLLLISPLSCRTAPAASGGYCIFNLYAFRFLGFDSLYPVSG